MMKLKTYGVNEFFVSLQGEGLHAGVKTLFFRFAGCNLKCPWCDTDHQKAHHKLSWYELLETIDRECQAENVKHITFTGGEPMLQLDKLIVCKLVAKGYKISVETNGTKDPLEVLGSIVNHENVWITCSPKEDYNFVGANEYKIVLDIEERVLCALDWIQANADKNALVYIQPCDRGDGRLAIDEVHDFLMKYQAKYNLRISYQLHKLGEWK